MKRSIFSGLILILMPFGLMGQWTEVNSPTGEIIYDVTFTSEDEGWAVGLEGVILHYSGVEWEVLDILTGNDFNRVEFTSENSGWAITGNGKVFHYDGNSWSLNFTTTGNKGLYTLYFLDTGEGYVSGEDGYIAYYDGGNWTEGNIGFNAWTLTSSFIDNKNGWLSSGAGVMYQFEDSVWSEISVPEINALMEMKFLGPDNGYGVGFDNNIWHYDGNSWDIEYTSINNTHQFLTDIHFLDENHGWASGQGSLFTYKYGIWNEEDIDPDWEIWDFHFTDPHNGWAVGSHGLLLRFAAEPLDWYEVNEIPPNFHITEISRTQQGELYAVGYTEGVLPAESEVALYKSSDGLSWKKISSDLDLMASVTTILAMDDVLLVSGYDKDFNFQVYKSVDDGLSWEVSVTGMSSQTFVQDMTVDENSIVYAVAKHFEPELYRSDNLGDSWTLITTSGLPVPSDPADADFINIASIGTELFAFHTETENNVMAIYKSTGGNNWSPMSSTPDNFFAVDLHVSESGLLYASGAFFDPPSDNHGKGIAYVSADQGNTWQLIDTYNLGDYSDTYYVSVASLGDELLLSTINANVDRDFRVFTTVKPQTQSIDFQAIPSKTYGDGIFEPVASATSGLTVEYHSSNPEVALVTGNSISINAAGVATITASQTGNGSFQAANSVEQLLTVNKAMLNVTVTNVSRDEGESNPVFELNYNGWVNGDNLDDLDVKPIASTQADISSPEGTYPITISAGMDNNYQFDYTEGILTVNKVDAVVTGLDDHTTATMKVFPNPVSDKLKLMPGPAGVSGQVLIYNSTGAIIKNQKFSGQILEMDFDTYPDGIYLIKIISSGRLTVHKVVKE